MNCVCSVKEKHLWIFTRKVLHFIATIHTGRNSDGIPGTGEESKAQRRWGTGNGDSGWQGEGMWSRNPHFAFCTVLPLQTHAAGPGLLSHQDGPCSSQGPCFSTEQTPWLFQRGSSYSHPVTQSGTWILLCPWNPRGLTGVKVCSSQT